MLFSQKWQLIIWYGVKEMVTFWCITKDMLVSLTSAAAAHAWP
jgi:hypothetical protein